MNNLEQLTTRERQCLMGVARHRQSKEIARDLGISSKTVDKHIETACKRLGVGSRRDAALLLLNAGLRSEPVGEPSRVEKAASNAAFFHTKGGPIDPDTSEMDLGLSRDRLRGFGADPGGESRRPAPGLGDAGDEPISLEARSAARDYLHRARTVARARSAAGRDPAEIVEYRRIGRDLLIVIALTCGIAFLLAGAIGATLMIQHLLQAADQAQRLR
ncbi:helix-turn-helix domain-containing protein [Brevundimonas sp.]|uniref:helix-turn-helix domain-containing protein n=1 Tax=Brevundimonas sp. TaxID=1871086 RepID=UPI003D12FD97